MSVATGAAPAAVAAEYEGVGFAQFKADLAETLIEMLAPIQAAYRRFVSDSSYLEAVFRDGVDRARERSRAKMREVRGSLGLPGR